MEVALNEQGNLEFIYDKMDMILSLLALGFSIALVVVVITASVRLGWKLWPWILGIGLLAFILV